MGHTRGGLPLCVWLGMILIPCAGGAAPPPHRPPHLQRRPHLLSLNQSLEAFLTRAVYIFHDMCLRHSLCRLGDVFWVNRYRIQS